MMADRPRPGWPPRGMPAPEAAYYIGLSVSTLHTLVERGELAPTRLTTGRQVYLREDLDAFLDRKKGKPDAGPADDGVPDWQKALDALGQDYAPVR
jgi:excisionase family DNA binding protein